MFSQVSRYICSAFFHVQPFLFGAKWEVGSGGGETVHVRDDDVDEFPPISFVKNFMYESLRMLLYFLCSVQHTCIIIGIDVV